MKFGNDLDKINSLIGRLMLKSALEENGFAADLNKLQYNEYGKPFFPGVYFSISHSGYLVTLAYSKVCELGIDCEKIVPIDMDMFNGFLSDSELSLGVQSVYQIWTRKEAALKALGIGIHEDMKHLSCIDDESDYNGKHISFKSIDIDTDYQCSLCTLTTQPSEAV